MSWEASLAAWGPSISRFTVRLLCGSSIAWALAALVALTLRRSSAALRHRLWALSMVAVLLLPAAVILLPEYPLGQIQVPIRAAASHSEAPTAVQPARPPDGADRIALPIATNPRPAPERGVTIDASPHHESLIVLLPEAPIPASPRPLWRLEPAGWITLAWLALALWLLARQALGHRAARRLIRHSTRLDHGPAAERLSRLVRLHGVARVPRLIERSECGSPLCLGVLRPTILLPAAWREWPGGQLDAVLTHELAHVARRDVPWQSLARFVCALYWPHPLAWLAAWRMRAEREVACDDWVLRGGESSTRYARWLVDIAARVSGRAPLPERVGVAMASRPGLEKRVRAVLDPNRPRFALSRRMSIGLTLLAAALLGLAGSLSPLAPRIVGAAAPAEPSVVDRSNPPIPAGVKTLPVVGRVEDEQGRPVAGVLIRVGLYAPLHNRIYTTRTDGEGRFDMTAPARDVDDNMLLARTDDGSRQASVFLDGSHAASETVNFGLILRPARDFPVTVTDERGSPVAGATVTAISWNSPVGEAATDSRGRALLRVCADAELAHVQAFKRGLGFDYLAFRRKDQPETNPYQLAPDHAGPLKFVLNGMRTVTLKVVDEAGHPIQGAAIWSWYYEKPRKGGYAMLCGPESVATTGADGDAKASLPVDQVSPMVFWPWVDGYYAPERCTWDPKSGKEVIQMRLARKVPVNGLAVGADGTPIPDATVRVMGDGFGMDPCIEQTQTASDGTFHLDVNGDLYYMFAASKGHLASAAHMQLVRQGSRPGPVRLVLKPGTRVYGHVSLGSTGVPRAGVTLIHRDDDTYDKLPRGQQLPGGVIGRKAIMPEVVDFPHAADDGSYEFFVGPGKYQLDFWSRSGNAREDFSVGGEKEIHVDLRAAPPGPALTLTGRIVRAENPAVAVSEATISTATTAGGSFQGVADAQGRFTIQRDKSDTYLCATSPDGLLRGITKFKPGDDHLVVPIGPMATAYGRLADATGFPLAGARLVYGLRVVETRGMFSWRFGGETTTAGDGTFALHGLVPGIPYEVEKLEKQNPQGDFNLYRPLTTAKALTPGAMHLGLIRYVPPTPPPGPADRMAHAFGEAGAWADRLRQAEHVAGVSHQNVLVVLGAPDRPACKQFYEDREDFDQRDVADALVDDWLVALDVDSPPAGARAWAETLKIAWPAGGMTLALLDRDGRLIAQATEPALTAAGKLNRQQLTEFLRAHAPAMPDARKLFDDAVSQARREHKDVLFDESGAYCPWCVKLADYLEANRSLVEKDFVWVTIDRRFAHGTEVIQGVHKEHEGIPWTAILDGEGHAILTSDGPKGNIGYPGEPGGREQWEKMLRAGARRLSDADIRQLLSGLKPAEPVH